MDDSHAWSSSRSRQEIPAGLSGIPGIGLTCFAFKRDSPYAIDGVSSKKLGWIGASMPRVECLLRRGLALHHERPQDARVLGGERDGGDILAAALTQLFDPAALEVISLGRMAHERARPVHQQRPEVDITALADAQQSGLATGGILFRRQAQPGGALATVLKLSGVGDSSNKSGGGERADAFKLPEPLAQWIVPVQPLHSAIAEGDALFEGLQFLVQVPE